MEVKVSTKRFQILPFLISLLITLTIGFVASLVTRPQIKTWYSKLHKPSFNPPGWLFPPVWTIIYIMIAFAAYLIWVQRKSPVNYVTCKLIYIVQLFLNFLWSIIFFGLHQIAAALIVIILLWTSIVLNIRWFSKINITAAWLLVPYLLWVSFASLLNFSIFLLNR